MFCFEQIFLHSFVFSLQIQQHIQQRMTLKHLLLQLLTITSYT
ncbi:hypothetical protein X975_19204, partial [Stegodyphus mimosarum]